MASNPFTPTFGVVPAFMAGREDITEGESAEVAQRLGDEHEHQEERNRDPDCQVEAVEADHGDGAGGAEERRGRDEVTSDGDTVGATADRTLGDEVRLDRVVAAARPVGDPEGQADEENEEDRCDPVAVVHACSLTRLL